MKAFCIALPGLRSSLEQARKCIETAASFDLEASLFVGTHRFEAVEVASESGLPRKGFDYVHWHRERPLRDAQLGCFLSHFRLWRECVALDQPIIVFEHDAVVRAPVPFIDPIACEVVNLQESIWNDPSWPFHSAVATLRDSVPTTGANCCEGGLLPGAYVCLPGTCAYWISPAASRRLIDQALNEGPLPADIFINKSVVNIKDCIPFPAIGEHIISTVAPGADWEGFDINNQ